MKNLWKIILTLLLTMCLLSLWGCKKEESKNSNIIKIGATPMPHSEILEKAKPLLLEKGFDLEIIEFNDYVQPNIALGEEEILANFFQHTPYMKTFSHDHNLPIISAGSIHLEPLGIYSNSLSSLDSISSGMKVSLPNDVTNHGRALLLLHNSGLITLKDPSNLKAHYKEDILKNPFGLDFTEIDSAMLPKTLDDVDISVINTNFALEAGLNPLEDSLYMEDKDSPYTNIIAILDKNKNDAKIQALLSVLQSEEIKSFILEKYKGAVIPAF